MIDSENLRNSHPSSKRFFEIHSNQGHGNTIQATFTQRQLVSR